MARQWSSGEMTTGNQFLKSAERLGLDPKGRMCGSGQITIQYSFVLSSHYEQHVLAHLANALIFVLPSRSPVFRTRVGTNECH
jgi:hypothetical protein